MRKLTDSVTGLCSVNCTRSQEIVKHSLEPAFNKWMCESVNTLWTFILTPMGILPNRENYQGYINVAGTSFMTVRTRQLNSYLQHFNEGYFQQVSGCMVVL